MAEGTSPPVASDPINAEPTKGFFVDMITRDISLEQAVLDLVDNSVDGAMRFKKGSDRPLDGYYIHIQVSGTRFSIVDNCGGFDKKVARRIRLPVWAAQRARECAELDRPVWYRHETRAIQVWEPIRYPVCNRCRKVGNQRRRTRLAGNQRLDVRVGCLPDTSEVSENNPGTEIEVSRLRPEVAARFGLPQFVVSITGLITSKHRQFIAQGIAIAVNGRHLVATSLNLLFSGHLKPGVDYLHFESEGQASVEARIIAGLGDSIPSAAGWYVVCNGRVILEADRKKETGWGIIEEETGELLIPKFHNQFARFRGIVTFDSTDASRVPWNTMKTDVDRESPVWQQTFVRMIEMMRPVIDFLNQLDASIQEYTSEGSALLKYVATATRVNTESLKQKRLFESPGPEDLTAPGPRWVSIQYSRPWPDIEFLQDALNVHSAKSVGERSFDLALKKQRGE